MCKILEMKSFTDFYLDFCLQLQTEKIRRKKKYVKLKMTNVEKQRFSI